MPFPFVTLASYLSWMEQWTLKSVFLSLKNVFCCKLKFESIKVIGFFYKIAHHDILLRRSSRNVLQNEVKLLSWAGNSPDTNPIENLWYLLEEEIHSVPIINKYVLIESVIHVWLHSFKIKVERINLIKSMPRLVEALINTKGGQTNYWLLFYSIFLSICAFLFE